MEKKETPQERYKKENIKSLRFEINKNTDKDILEKLETVKNKQGYVKMLIRKDEEIFKNI